MVKPPLDLEADELIARAREDAKKIRAAQPVEENAPVDLESQGVGLDTDGTDEG